MKSKRWHILVEGNALTVARRLPVRFDLAVVRYLPDASRLRIAQQVRQDIWRALQRVKGFAPVVEVTREEGALRLKAGGQVDGAFARRSAEAKIADVLDSAANRRRWLSWAS